MTAPPVKTSSHGILLVGHGSRDPAGVAEFRTLAEAVQTAVPERPCTVGFLEFARPLISDGLHQLVEQGARHITALPGMLMAAGHAKNDIPSELNAFQANHPDVRVTYGAELGIDPKLLQAASARIEVAEEQAQARLAREETLLLVVGRGASDPDANGNIAKITRMLWEGMGFGWAETCYIGVTQPLLVDSLKRVRYLGFRQIIVLPYFLFTGRLVERIYEQVQAFQAEHPELRVLAAGYLHTHPQVIAAFLDRLRQAEAGEARMNCQLCQYREQIIGHEYKVGAPQQGHHHHVRGAGTDHDHHPG